MKTIITSSNISSDSIFNSLQYSFPDYKIKKESKNIITIRNNEILVAVVNKKNEIKVSGDLSYKNKKIFLLLVLGVLLGVIGVFFILIILYIVYNKKIKNMRNEVLGKLNFELGVP
jgi:predicted RND superfamily exporter protein